MQLQSLFHKPINILLPLFWCIAFTCAIPSPEPLVEPAFINSRFNYNNNNNNANANTNDNENYQYDGNFVSGPSIYAYTIDNQLNSLNDSQKQQQQQVQQEEQQHSIRYNHNNNNNKDNNNNNNNYIINFATNGKYNGNNNNNNFKSKEQFVRPTASPSRPYDISNKFGYKTSAQTTTALTPTQSAPNIGCNFDRLAVYKVVLHTYWTRDLFPKHYPDWRPTAQWTKSIGRTHDASFALFHIGQQATAGVKQFAETGKTEMLDNLTTEHQQQQQLQSPQQQQQEQQSTKISANERKVFDEFNIPAIVSGAGRSEAKFFVDSNHSLVSLMTRIVPSPDWFIGVDSFQLCVGGAWIDTVTLEVDPLDAGTDNGFTFTAPNWPTSPQGVIYRITSRYPAHPAGSFFYPKNKRLPPIATFQFIKLKEYELSEVFNFAEDDRKYETVKTQVHLESDQNHVELNNELSASIERERQNELLSKPTAESERDRVRSELLAKMNSLNSTSAIVTTNGVAFNSNVVPKNDKNAILQNIVHRYQSNGFGKRRRTKRPRDCRVSHWSEWSTCSKTCGIGEMHRYRKVIKHGKRGGRHCPALRESKWCGSEKGCHPANNYFNW